MTTFCRTVARLVVGILVVALGGVVATAPPASASAQGGEGTGVFFDVVLQVSPEAQSALGTELTLSVTASFGGTPMPSGDVVFLLDGDDIASVSVEGVEPTTFTYTPSGPGLHTFSAGYTPEHYGITDYSEDVEHRVVDPMTVVPRVRLGTGAIGDRAPAGVQVGLSASIEDPWSRAVVGEEVVFLADGVPIATAEVVLDFDVLIAWATFTPTQGVQELTARFLGAPGVPSASSWPVVFSGLPDVCPDQARPGSGALVRLAYLAVLGRCPDPAGFAYWTGRLDGGASASGLARGLALSVEGMGATVDAAYRQVLARPSDPTGRAVWVAKLRAGWTTSQLWAALAASPEFMAGASGAVVDRAFERLVGRPVDEASRGYWDVRLNISPRSGALRSLVLTPEALGRTVGGIHRAVLGETPSAAVQAEIQRGIKARRGDWRHLAVGLLGLDRARAHAQTYPDPAG